jgi:hypothetical protein
LNHVQKEHFQVDLLGRNTSTNEHDDGSPLVVNACVEAGRGKYTNVHTHTHTHTSHITHHTSHITHHTPLSGMLINVYARAHVLTHSYSHSLTHSLTHSHTHIPTHSHTIQRYTTGQRWKHKSQPQPEQLNQSPRQTPCQTPPRVTHHEVPGDGRQETGDVPQR